MQVRVGAALAPPDTAHSVPPLPLAKFPAPKRLEVSRWTKTGCLAVDFVDPESTGRFLEKLKSLPALYICVSNAGLTRHGPLEDVTEEAWDATNDVNLKAPFFVSQAAAEIMKRDGYGRIVNVRSIWGVT